MPKSVTRRQQAFLDAYRVYGSVQIAAKKAGLSRELHYNALRVSQAYRDAFAAIEREHKAALVAQGEELAKQGPIAPCYYGKKVVAFRPNPSISLLIRRLEAADPEKFRSHRHRLVETPEPGAEANLRCRMPPLTVRRVSSRTAEPERQPSAQRLRTRLSGILAECRRHRAAGTGRRGNFPVQNGAAHNPPAGPADLGRRRKTGRRNESPVQDAPARDSPDRPTDIGTHPTAWNTTAADASLRSSHRAPRPPHRHERHPAETGR